MVSATNCACLYRFDTHGAPVFATSLTKRLVNNSDDLTLNELETQIRGLPLQPSPIVTARQDELDEVGTELWNLSTRLRRDVAAIGTDGKEKEEIACRKRSLCLLRAFSFLILDSAGGQTKKRHQRKSCIRLMKIALKAAKVCIDSKEFSSATKVLERAAEYQDVLSEEGESGEAMELANHLRVEYFAVRTTLVSRIVHMCPQELPRDVQC